MKTPNRKNYDEMKFQSTAPITYGSPDSYYSLGFIGAVTITGCIGKFLFKRDAWGDVKFYKIESFGNMVFVGYASVYKNGKKGVVITARHNGVPFESVILFSNIHPIHPQR